VHPHLLVVRGQDSPERVPLAGPVRAGGGAADAIALPGAPARAVTLVPAPAGVVVEAGADGVRAAGVPLARGERRLLRPGEQAEVGGAALLLPAAGEEGTRASAGALVRAAAQGRGAPAGPHLLVLSGAAAGARIALRDEQTVGRGAAADVRLDDAHASRLHARIRVEDAGAVVEDLGSKNGVRVNGARVRRRTCRLAPGDEIALGATALAFVGPAAEPTAPAAPRPRPAAGPLAAALAAAALLALCAAALALAA
jgi:hypothetical protein